ncbi:MAG: class I SAM-dependent methyltransferase [Okeania sp. SIO3I5]|uniref:class I SAM-dependent methyltransferase n=1 Tax=Okeania sp. SIO3I5 TaxID=2607805 RepID=UPI0013B8F7AD|nr:class I SAM-dependent methyltransferase [Okeania sp. SIO3I5]NEQ41174.1 class I SAM-dependent methyltransferase [Okeania sp. SIO3I5]
MTNNTSLKQTFFDRWAPSYDWLFPSVVYQAIHQRLLEYVNLPTSANVLDLGCGTGKLLNRLAVNFPNLQGTGLDLSSEMISQANSRNRYPQRLIFVSGNAEEMPLENDVFDAVFNTISFLHYPDPPQVLNEVNRVLRPGGYFYLVDSYFKWQDEFQYLSISPGGLNLYSPIAREKLGKEAGLNLQANYYLLGAVLLTIFTKQL